MRENFVLLQLQGGREPDHDYHESQRELTEWIKLLRKQGLGLDQIIQYFFNLLENFLHPEDTDAVSMTILRPTAWSSILVVCVHRERS